MATKSLTGLLSRSRNLVCAVLHAFTNSCDQDPALAADRDCRDQWPYDLTLYSNQNLEEV
jgi:hypothetical protein